MSLFLSQIKHKPANKASWTLKKTIQNGMKVAIMTCSLLSLIATAATPGAFTLANQPLYLPNNPTPNVLLTMDSSFSMLNDPTDTTYKGGLSTGSKADLAAQAASNFVSSNQGKINVGLMTYRYQGSNLALVYTDYDKDDYDGSTNVYPFRLTPYPTGTGISAAPYDTAGNASTGKSYYRFAPGELIHYRVAVVNRGPEKSINPRLKLMLPANLVLSGYNTTTGQYSGFKTKMSQHAGENWTCHSPSATAGKYNSPSTPYGQTPALDQKIYCDTSEINFRETVFFEFYAYWSGYGSGEVLPLNVYIADSQCESSATCNSYFTPRDPNGSSAAYNGLFNNYGSVVTMPLTNTVGMVSQYSNGVIGSPSRIKMYMWLNNYTGSNFNQTLEYKIRLDPPQGGASMYPSASSGNRLTPVSAQEVTYSTACGKMADPTCYTANASSGWTCAGSDYISGDALGSPDGNRGLTCNRVSGMPPTLPNNKYNTSEIIEVVAETNTGYDITLANIGTLFKTVSYLRSPSDTAHLLDPGYNGGAGFGAIGPNDASGACTNYIAVQQATGTAKSDTFAPPPATTVGFYGPSPAYCFGTPGAEAWTNTAPVSAVPAYATYATPGNGYLRSPISLLTSSKFKEFVGTDGSLFGANHNGKLYPYSSSDGTFGGDAYSAATDTFTHFDQGTSFFYETPLAGTIETAKRYFNQNLVANENGTGYALSDINTLGNKFPALPPSPCGRNYMILLTDGNPTIDANGNKYPDLTTATLDTMAKAKDLYDAGITLYVIALGSGADLTTANAIAQAGSGGSCSGVTCTGGTLAYSAGDLTSLNAAFNSITAAFLPLATSAQVSYNQPTGINSTPFVLSASYSPEQWTGTLMGYKKTTTGLSTYFSGSDWITEIQNYFTGTAQYKRNFFTSKRPSLSNGDAPGVSKGVVFNWPVDSANPTTNEINTWQSDLLNKNELGASDGKGQLRLNWMKGDVSNEGATDPAFRSRVTHLGDIINSSPLVVGAPSDNSIPDNSYATFRATYKNRLGMIYVGSNDGWFHGFRVTGQSASTSTRALEKFAFTPSFVYPKFSQLMRQDYAGNHVYTMDGTPSSGDVYFNGDSSWHTLVAAGAGAGGRGYFALDVTDPGVDSLGNINIQDAACVSTPSKCLNMQATDNNANKLLRWEFTSENSGSGTIDSNGIPTGIVTGDSDLGFTFSKPIITRILSGSGAPYSTVPVVIFGNGYNNTDTTMGPASTTGKAALYIVNAETGYLIRKISVPGGSPSVPNGLGTPLALDVDHDGRVDRVYAADLLGRVWRFNLYDGSSKTASDFQIAFGGQPLYTATDGSGSPRSITGEIRAAFHPDKGYMIMFGSGQYLAKTDVKSSYTSTDEDAFYSVWDRDESTYIPNTSDPRNFLNGVSVNSCQHQTNAGDTTAGDNTCLSVTNPAASANTYIKTESNSTPKPYCGPLASPSLSCVMGCYLEFKNIPVAGYNGERFIYSPVIGGKSVQVNSIMPPQNSCSLTDYGLTSEYIIDYMNCTALAKTPYDINQDGSFTSLDVLTGTDNMSFNPSGQLVSGLTPPSARSFSFNGPTTLYDKSSINQSAPVRNYVNITTSGGRISWREMQPHLINPKEVSEGKDPGHAKLPGPGM